jgi:hypothetical protein
VADHKSWAARKKATHLFIIVVYGTRMLVSMTTFLGADTLKDAAIAMSGWEHAATEESSWMKMKRHQFYEK